MSVLAVIPVHNERESILRVLTQTLVYVPDVLVVDDGSTDGTEKLLENLPDVKVLPHCKNMGYGRTLIDGFDYAVQNDFDAVVTLDADGQHDPSRIPAFLAELADVDIVSGSRYMTELDEDSMPPPDRLRINRLVAQDLELRLGLELTDAFCGFKAYRTDALRRMRLTETGYAMPVELWVQAAALRLRIKEIPVPRIYVPTADRTFGGRLDRPDVRLRYYRDVLERASAVASLPGPAVGMEVPSEGACGSWPVRHPRSSCSFHRERD